MAQDIKDFLLILRIYMLRNQTYLKWDVFLFQEKFKRIE
jgi:hypothetical protein